MAKPKVNIAEYFADAIKETGKEQLEYIQLEKLDQDPNNFYSLEGIDELAGNIELIGLQQPLRVRAESDGRYTIVSGHRRRAAIMLIQDGGSEQFKDGIPCIVERGEESAAMRELRLIYANASTRVMSPAEISKQAERVEMLLYQLKEEGVIEFPGRMRDHVAEACRISKTKLARLHAIRKNLAPDLLAWFDKGSLNETISYELQKLPMSAQEEIAASVKRSGSPDFINVYGAEHCAKNADKFMEKRSCPNGGECDHHEKRFVQALRASMTWERCNGGCCLKCGHYSESCPHACSHVKAKQKMIAEERKVERETEKEKEAKRQAERDKKILESLQAQAQRVLPLIRAKGLKNDDKLPCDYYGTRNKVSIYEKLAVGDLNGDHWYDDRLIPTTAENLKEMAGMLDCSVDYLLGLTEDPSPAAKNKPVSGSDTTFSAASTWKTGEPAEDGEYVVIFGAPKEESPKTRSVRIMKWGMWGWVNPISGVANIEGMNVYRWMRLEA